MKTKYSFWLTKPKCWLHDAVSIWSHIMIWAMVRILFIEWPIIKREFAICKFVSFFHSCKTWVAMCMSPLIPSNKIIWLSELCYLQICQLFLSCKLGRFACASLLMLTHSHPFLWVPQKMWSHPDNCTCCFELAQAFLCLPPTQRSKHTQEKFIPESKLCAKSLEVVSYKLSSRSARRLAKNKRPHDMSWTLT